MCFLGNTPWLEVPVTHMNKLQVEVEIQAHFHLTYSPNSRQSHYILNVNNYSL